jgi:hypothetical protein
MQKLVLPTTAVTTDPNKQCTCCSQAAQTSCRRVFCVVKVNECTGNEGKFDGKRRLEVRWQVWLNDIGQLIGMSSLLMCYGLNPAGHE